jgi:two-component system KDP operon response regulator KdpE
VRNITKRFLSRIGYLVDAAAGGAEALELFRRNPGAYSCVILDIGLPDMDGEEVMRAMLAAEPSARIIGSSGKDEAEGLARLRESGMYAYLQKPYAMEDLQALVEEALRGR